MFSICDAQTHALQVIQAVKHCSVGVQVSSFPLAMMFGMCSIFLFLATLCQKRLENLTSGTAAGKQYSAVSQAVETS